MIGLSRTAGVPHKGWSLVDVGDLGEPNHTCEFCGVAEVRYVHALSHPEYPENVLVGCVCAEHMTGDYVGPREREKQCRARSSRRARWTRLRWRATNSGALQLRRNGTRYLVSPRATGGYRASFYNGDWINLRDTFITESEAMLALFDRVEEA